MTDAYHFMGGSSSTTSSYSSRQSSYDEDDIIDGDDYQDNPEEYETNFYDPDLAKDDLLQMFQDIIDDKPSEVKDLAHPHFAAQDVKVVKAEVKKDPMSAFRRFWYKHIRRYRIVKNHRGKYALRRGWFIHSYRDLKDNLWWTKLMSKDGVRLYCWSKKIQRVGNHVEKIVHKRCPEKSVAYGETIVEYERFKLEKK